MGYDFYAIAEQRGYAGRLRVFQGRPSMFATGAAGDAYEGAARTARCEGRTGRTLRDKTIRTPQRRRSAKAVAHARAADLHGTTLSATDFFPTPWREIGDLNNIYASSTCRSLHFPESPFVFNSVLMSTNDSKAIGILPIQVASHSSQTETGSLVALIRALNTQP